MISNNEGMVPPANENVAQIGRLNPRQVRNLAETIGEAFLFDQYNEGVFHFDDAWRTQFRDFLTTGAIHDNIAETVALLTAPNPVISRFGDALGLEEALTRGDIRQAYQYMLESEANVSVADKTQLAQWINNRDDNDQAINTLIAPDNDVNLQAFFDAVIIGNIDYVIEVINHIDSDLMMENLSLTDDEGNTALHFAALHGHFELALNLMHAGANVEIFNNDGNNAIHYAVISGSFETLENILSLHPQEDTINRANNNGDTPIALTENEDLRDILLENGAEDNREPSRAPSPIDANAALGKRKDREDDSHGDGRGGKGGLGSR